MSKTFNFDPEYLFGIASNFKPFENILNITELHSGIVNKTFLVDYLESGVSDRFILQSLNRNVFHEPELLLNNYLLIQEHISTNLKKNKSHARRWEFPKLLKTIEHFDYFFEIDGQVWRAITYIKAARTYDVISSLRQAREVGLGLGMFHFLLNDFDCNRLSTVIKDFHCTSIYLDKYEYIYQTVAKQSSYYSALKSKLKIINNLIELYKDDSYILSKAFFDGDLSRLPIHGDPKLNNIMFDNKTSNVVGLIDLDTVQPGLIHYDIGDCLRSCCNSFGEDSLQIEKIHFDLSICASFLKGYLSTNPFLTKIDFYYIPYAIRIITLELGVRFLNDFLCGTKYFKSDYPLQNFHRAECQFSLLSSINSQWDSIVDLVDDCSQGYPY